MRIPSGLNDHNLYRQRRAPPRSSLHAYRRLLRLALALTLVIVVMREASRPKWYTTFFPETVEPSNHPSRLAHGNVTTRYANRGEGVASVAGDEDEQWPPWWDSRWAFRDAVAALRPASKEALIAELARHRQDPASAGGENTREVTSSNLDDASGSDDIDSLVAASTLREALIELREHWPPESSPDAVDGDRLRQLPLGRDSLTDRTLATQIQTALDLDAISRVDPASVWKSRETVAFYRSLESPEAMWFGNRPSSPGAIALLQQPEVYLHRPIATVASVARVTRREAVENPLGIESYWELWLRPRDGSDQPIAFFALELPGAISTLAGLPYVSDGPIFRFEGTFLKRLAYRSETGSQLAPAIVGRVVVAKTTADDDTTGLSGRSTAEAPNAWVLLVIAAGLGVGLAALLFWRLRRLDERSRGLRRSGETFSPTWQSTSHRPLDTDQAQESDDRMG